MPPLAPQGGFALVSCRALALACLLGGFGTLGFRLWVARGIAAADRPVRGCLIGFATAGLPLLAAWTLLQTADFAGTTPLAGLALVPQVLGQTAFGQAIAAQAVGLALILGLAVWAWRPAGRGLGFALATAVLLLHIRHGHAGAERSALLAGSEALHLAAAGGWLGSFLPLLLALRRVSAADASLLLRRYRHFGAVCVVGLLVSAPVQYATLIGSLPALVGTGYGLLGVLKGLLFLILLGFAAVNRLGLGAALERADGGGKNTRRHLMWSVGVETLVGLAVVFAAAAMAQSAPGMHQQPIWPFAARFSLVRVDADGDFRREVVIGVIELAACVCLLGGAALGRGWARYAALAVGLALPFVAAPHLSLLLVPANPDSYFRSTSGFTDASIVRGAALYPANCAACHGGGGHGDGDAAAGLPVPPADLTAAHLWEHTDGDLFWWLAHGMVAPNGKPAMPGFAATLSDEDRWALIDFIRARNAGDTLFAGADGFRWAVPLPAPLIALDCGAGPGPTLADLRGHFVLLGFGPKAPIVAPNLAHTVWVDPRARPTGGLCAATDPAAMAAFAIATGRARLDGAGVIVGPTGLLQALRPGGFGDPAALALALREIRATAPLAAPAGVMPGMRM